MKFNIHYRDAYGKEFNRILIDTDYDYESAKLYAEMTFGKSRVLEIHALDRESIESKKKYSMKYYIEERETDDTKN